MGMCDLPWLLCTHGSASADAVHSYDHLPNSSEIRRQRSEPSVSSIDPLRVSINGGRAGRWGLT